VLPIGHVAQTVLLLYLQQWTQTAVNLEIRLHPLILVNNLFPAVLDRVVVLGRERYQMNWTNVDAACKHKEQQPEIRHCHLLVYVSNPTEIWLDLQIWDSITKHIL